MKQFEELIQEGTVWIQGYVQGSLGGYKLMILTFC